MKIWPTAFWKETPCSLVYVYWRFGRSACCLVVSCFSRSSTLEMKAVRSFETSVNFYMTTRYHITKHSTLYTYYSVYITRGFAPPTQNPTIISNTEKGNKTHVFQEARLNKHFSRWWQQDNYWQIRVPVEPACAAIYWRSVLLLWHVSRF
jgi:hypothetical protein